MLDIIFKICVHSSLEREKNISNYITNKRLVSRMYF